MADSAVTPYVFLDTEVYRAYWLDFQSPNIRRLVRLAVGGAVRLLLTSVTRGEVMDDLKENAQKVIKYLKEGRRLSSTMRKIMPGDAVEAIEAVKREEAATVLQEEFAAFIAETEATVLGVDCVSAEGVFQKYFEGTPPFGGQGDNKKVEFPDAFAFGALEAWSAANKYAKVYVVGNDGDWKQMCEGHPSLISVARLDELLQHFTDTEIGFAIKKGLEAQREKLLEMVRAKAEGLVDLDVGDMLIDGETLEVDIRDFHVVEIRDGRASVSVPCEVSVSADGVADDPESRIEDSETKSVYDVFRMPGTAEVSVAYDTDDPEQITIESVEFTAEALVIRDSPSGSPTTLRARGVAAPRASVFGSSSLNLLGGVVNSIDAYDTSSVLVTRRQPQALGLTNGRLAAHGASTVEFRGDTVGFPFYLGAILALDSSRVSVRGAEAGSVAASGNSRVKLAGLRLHWSLSVADEAVVEAAFVMSPPPRMTLSDRGKVVFNSIGLSGRSPAGVTLTGESTLVLCGATDYPPGPVTETSGRILFGAALGVHLSFSRAPGATILINPSAVPDPVA